MAAKSPTVEKLLPASVRDRLRLMRHRIAVRAEHQPLADVFHDIYELDLWGRADDRRYCSGDAAAHRASRGFEDYVTQHLWRTPTIRTVVDIGCGDFQVASRILARAGRPIRYIGCDIAGNVIRHNAGAYGQPGAIEFVEMDATRDPPPLGDLVLVREVFQHLSNAHAQAVIDQIRGRFGAAIISDSVAKGARSLNADIVSGDRPRTAYRSGIFVEAAPFHMNVLDRRHESLSSRILARTLLVEL